MSDSYFGGAKKVALGAICTSSKHLLVLLRQNIIAPMHPFGLALRRVRRRRNIGHCIHNDDKEDGENQCNALIMHHAPNTLIGINEN
jgi:hypothetical protein